MYCTSCGAQMGGADKFCSQCGKGAMPAQTAAGYRRLDRFMAEKKIAGVCSGIARHYGWDVTIVRVIFLALFVLRDSGCCST